MCKDNDQQTFLYIMPMSTHTRDRNSLIGIDVGGTHTDIVVTRPDGTLVFADKVASNPTAPVEAIQDALDRIPRGTPVSLCVNGTTIGINALLQHKLPRVGLVATKGFGDILHIRRETKANIYDLDWRKPSTLIPRHLTFEVDERIGAGGEVVKPLGDPQALLDWLDAVDLDEVAVCLLHAYRNSTHERLVRDAILGHRPGARVTLSTDVWPEWREFERTYNTALNAALKPIVADYLDGLVKAVKKTTGQEDVYLMHADGGILRPAEIAERPVLTLLSGTVAGALLGARVAHDAGYEAAVSLDMGGTSTDIGFSEGGRPRRSAELSIEWEGTLGFSGIDVASIGAGGGSIVWADEANGLHVGPTSAGADPGPACYGRGGERPALTDVYLALGYLGPAPVIGGRQLSKTRAMAALQGLVEQTKLDPIRLCAGVYEIASSNLAAGIRRVTIERGVDPRTCALMCFGGAGPLHAAALVKHIGLASALIPPRPGNGSALGLLLAPVKHGVSQTLYAALDELPNPDYQKVVDELRRRAVAALPETGEDVTLTWHFALRYRGQTRELAVEVPDSAVGELSEPDRSAVEDAFHAKHESEFTFSAPSEPIQLVTIRCEATLPPRSYGRSVAPEIGHHQEETLSDTEAWFLGDDGAIESVATRLLQRDSVKPLESIDGPAIIMDVGSTILLPPGSSARVDDMGNMILEWP